MFIYHFNRLIRNRILWGFFAIIISLAFVSVGSCMRSPQQGQTAGTINNKTITLAEFTLATQAIRGFGQNRDNEMSASVVDRRAWEQLAAHQLARENGLQASAEEIRGALREAPAFQGPNGFDINRYRYIIAQQGLTPTKYEQLVAHQISLMKNAALIKSADWVSPMELEDELAGMTDLFTVQTTVISNTFAEAEMALTDDDYLKFYEENKASFALPEQVSVQYVAIPVTNYITFVSVSKAEMEEYYDSNIENYQQPSTNNTTETLPFDDVKDKIEKVMLRDEARYCASTTLTFKIYGRLAMSSNVLEETAATHGVAVKTSPLFSASDKLAWAQNAEEFITTAFELDPERSDSRIGIVTGVDYIYVIQQLKRLEAHTPEFEKVLNQIRPRALAKARSDAFTEYTEQLNQEISALMEQGKTFAEAANSKAMNVSTSITYSVNSVQNQKFEHSFAVAYGAMSLRKGELSKAIPASATESLLVYVQDRQPGDALSGEMMRPQVRAGIARRRSGDLFSGWLAWNLKQQNFAPQLPLAPEGEEETILSSERDDDDEI
ncbi:MAG: SurA N-terminal domain-containing protein [Kiritimatiellae bacterium]|nr:SurA N-terminal domain-containing protein [Kiritimatiellia bacterium]